MKAVSWADLFFRTPTLFPEHRPGVGTTLPARAILYSCHPENSTGKHQNNFWRRSVCRM